MLLEYADVNAVSGGRTALVSLIMALSDEGPTLAHKAQVALVSLLLEHGADLTVADNEGRAVREVLEKAQHRSDHLSK